jgi:hypothetical protein
MGDKEGAAPGEIISARTVPANEVVTKLLVDLIASLLLPVCRRKEAEFDIIPELFQTTMAIELGADSDDFSKARAHLTQEGVGLSSSQPNRPSTAIASSIHVCRTHLADIVRLRRRLLVAR